EADAARHTEVFGLALAAEQNGARIAYTLELPVCGIHHVLMPLGDGSATEVTAFRRYWTGFRTHSVMRAVCTPFPGVLVSSNPD
ncbi:MAG TPA: hypothetical protein VE422_06240, partial [Terriglobia bacterium]|nr:hypothetical protein [Terriglobia bacterium]